MSSEALQSLSDPERLKTLLEEAENELASIQPRITEIEKQIETLQQLKQAKQRLITLKMSLMAMLENATKDYATSDKITALIEDTTELNLKKLSFDHLSTQFSFHPDEALQEADHYLKQKTSLNYHIFEAVVYKGGKASTQEIKDYLVEIGTKLPQTGESFDQVPLTDVSSRANYLVRKGILHPMERGHFYTHLGWR